MDEMDEIKIERMKIAAQLRSMKPQDSLTAAQIQHLIVGAHYKLSEFSPQGDQIYLLAQQMEDMPADEMHFVRLAELVPTMEMLAGSLDLADIERTKVRVTSAIDYLDYLVELAVKYLDSSGGNGS